MFAIFFTDMPKMRETEQEKIKKNGYATTLSIIVTVQPLFCWILLSRAHLLTRYKVRHLYYPGSYSIISLSEVIVFMKRQTIVSRSENII